MCVRIKLEPKNTRPVSNRERTAVSRCDKYTLLYVSFKLVVKQIMWRSGGYRRVAQGLVQMILP